jgi:hypothetical protein
MRNGAKRHDCFSPICTLNKSVQAFAVATDGMETGSRGQDKVRFVAARAAKKHKQAEAAE